MRERIIRALAVTAIFVLSTTPRASAATWDEWEWAKWGSGTLAALCSSGPAGVVLGAAAVLGLSGLEALGNELNGQSQEEIMDTVDQLMSQTST